MGEQSGRSTQTRTESRAAAIGAVEAARTIRNRQYVYGAQAGLAEALSHQAAQVRRAAREAEQTFDQSAYLARRTSGGRWQQLLRGITEGLRLSLLGRPQIADYRARQAESLRRDWEAISRDMWRALERAERARAERQARNQQQLFNPEDVAPTA